MIALQWQNNTLLCCNAVALVSTAQLLTAYVSAVYCQAAGSMSVQEQKLTCTWAADQSELATTPDSRDSLASDEVVPTCNQEVSDDDIFAYAKSQHAEVFATSAKTGAGVRRLFVAIAEDLANTVQEAQCQHTHTHRHTVRPALPTFMNTRPGTNPSSPLDSNHNATYTRTKRKYFPSSCC